MFKIFVFALTVTVPRLAAQGEAIETAEMLTGAEIVVRCLVDRYADYWQQNRGHVLANHAYCVRNPGNWAGYGPACWGLTASDDPDGYVAHSPTDDRGVISPTAALRISRKPSALSAPAARPPRLKSSRRISCARTARSTLSSRRGRTCSTTILKPCRRGI